MAKAKSKAIIMTADGAGGMAQIQDRRFETDDWPIRIDVPKDQADAWLQYLSAECRKRGWSSGGITQLEARENSGSLTINTDDSGQSQLALVWERRRDGPIKVWARSAGTFKFPVDKANEFFRQINERSRARATEHFHRGWQLCYDGLPWCGELWLDETLRLGPPSQQDNGALIGPRIILVNALIKGIDQEHAASAFDVALRELSVFLTVVMGTNVRVSPNGGRGWTWSTDSNGQVECDIRNLGYWEKQWPKELPAKGQIQSIPLRAVFRPDFSLRGIDGTQTELHLPEDILDLWRAFTGLAPDRRRQFLQVGSMWQLALSLGHDYQTARFAWMVAACEVLKPPGPQYRYHNIYHVVEALLGKPVADQLQEQWFRPQQVRNAHLHRGEFRGSEFVQYAMMSSFHDPTFDQACRALYEITQAAIIEWLRRNGVFTMAPLERRKTWRRWAKDHDLLVLPVAVGLGIGLGIVLRWFLRELTSS